MRKRTKQPQLPTRHSPNTTNPSIMSVINISSKEQFSSLLISSRFVVADCKSLTPRRALQPHLRPSPIEKSDADHDPVS